MQLVPRQSRSTRARTPRRRQTGVSSSSDASHVRPARRKSKGLQVLAGHGLTYVNVQPIVGIEQIEELNIGHSVVSRAVLVGMERAVREMVELLESG